jgi:hypothetical protein
MPEILHIKYFPQVESYSKLNKKRKERKKEREREGRKGGRKEEN